MSKKATEKSVSHTKKSEVKDTPISYASALKAGKAFYLYIF
jgi:hypothetical protein